MSYERIAKQVHEYVKNPESSLTQGKRLAEKQVKTAELSILQNVFSRYKVSGNTLYLELNR